MAILSREQIKYEIKSLKIETPSWGYGLSGTRFKVFHDKEAARDIWEKLEDAAEVHRYTGVCPKVAIHIPWDKVDDYTKIKDKAKELGIKIGAINPNLFQEEDYKFGSLCNSQAQIRRKAIEHIKECVDIAKDVNSKIISLWLPDGTNYPGQGSFVDRKHWLQDSLKEAYDYMEDDMTLLIEYKCFEPAFYHTDLADWGMSLNLANKLGERARVLVDLGHHFQGVNVEHIVAYLLDEKRMGGFHFNNKKYADDDLIVGAINPYELFLIMKEIHIANFNERTKIETKNIAYMIDQSHCIEPKIPAMIRSVMNIQTAYAKALFIDIDELGKAQRDNDVLKAESIVKGAFETDVKEILEEVRKDMGLCNDPMKAFLESNYNQHTLKSRK